VFAFTAIAFALPSVPTLTPPPVTPEVNTPTESPNNSLSGQTNIVRPLERIPDLYGKNKVYPDLIIKPYFEYVNHVKTLIEYMCIGRGAYSIPAATRKTGDTTLSDIDGTTDIIYGPSLIQPGLLNVTESNEVNGQELFGPNVLKVDIRRATISFPTTSTFQGTDSRLAAFASMTTFDNIDILDDPPTLMPSVPCDFLNDTITLTGTDDWNNFLVNDLITVASTVSNNGTWIVDTISEKIITCIDEFTGAAATFTTETSPTTSVGGTLSPNAGSFSVTNYSAVDFFGIIIYTITVFGTPFTTGYQPYNLALISTGVFLNPPIVGPFNVPGLPDQVWIDVLAPQGLINLTNRVTVNIQVSLQETTSGGTPIGSPELSTVTLSDRTHDARFYTFKLTPANPGGYYTISLERFTNTDTTAGVGERTVWGRLAGVENNTVADFGDVTTWYVKTQATDQATKVQQRKYNLICTRMLSTYDRINDDMSTPLAATARIADAVVHMLTDSAMGNKAESQIDLEGLYDIQDDLDVFPIYGDTLGRFCYSFSNTRTPVGDEVKTALRAGRMFMYQDGNIIRFGRDKAQSTRRMLINRRIKKPDSETKTIRQFKLNDFDGIELRWTGEESGEAETIIFPESPGVTVNPMRIDAAGIKNYQQAWNRAAIEYNILIYRRTTVTTTVLRDGLILHPNWRVGNVDSTTLSTQDGEIISGTLMLLGTSEPIDFEGNPSGEVILRFEDGSVSVPITCTPRFDGVDGFILAVPASGAIYHRGDIDNYQMGTLYTFSPDSDLEPTDYTVQEITPGEDEAHVDLVLVNFTNSVYTPDVTIPTVWP